MKGWGIVLKDNHCLWLPPACVLNRLAEKSRRQVFATGVGKFLIAFLVGVVCGVLSDLIFRSIALVTVIESIVLGTVIGMLIVYIVLEVEHL